MAARVTGIILALWLPVTTRAAQHNVIAGNLRVDQIPGYSYSGSYDDNTNAIVTCTLAINGFTAVGGPPFNRADFYVWAYPGALGTNDANLGFLIGSVAQNGRTNPLPTYGTNCWQICQTVANADNTLRFATCQTVGSLGTGNTIECNANVAAAFFPMSNWLGGWCRSLPYTNGYPNNWFLGSPGLLGWTNHGAYTNFFDLYGLTGGSGGQSTVSLTNFGINSLTDGILLVTGGKDENNFVQSRRNADGTWQVYVHDIGADSTAYEQDQFVFVYVPKTNTLVVSGMFQSDSYGNPSITNYSGAQLGVTNYVVSSSGGYSICPVFTITNIAAGRWYLTMNNTNFTPTNGVLITSPAGGGSYNVDNIVTCQATNSSKFSNGWEIQSRDLPSGNLQSPYVSGGSEDVCSFVFIPANNAFIAVAPTQNLQTTTAGGTATFTVVLQQAPTANVTIGVSSSDTNEGTVDTSTLTFTSSNWNTPQTVTITGVENGLSNTNVAYTIILAAAVSTDTNYNGMKPSNVAVTNVRCFTWNGGAGNGVWSSGAAQSNWSGGVYAPGNSGGPYDFVFTAASPAGPSTITLAGGHNPDVNNLTINANAWNPTTIALTNGTSNDHLDLNPASSGVETVTILSGSHTITNTGAGSYGYVQLQGQDNQVFDIGSGAALTISPVIKGDAGTRGFTKTGAGTLTLRGANTYGGGTILSGGKLVAMANASALGTGALTLNGASATLELDNNSGLSFNNNVTVSSDATINPGRLTPGAGVTHTLGTLSIGPNTLTIAGASTVTSGTAQITFGNVTLTGTPTFTVNNPAGGGTTTLSLGAVNNGAYTAVINGNGNLVQTGVWGNGAGGITYSGTGSLTLSQANTYTGGTTLSSGKLVLGPSGSISSSPQILVSSGATFDVSRVSAGFSLGSGQWLGGSGVVTGSVTVAGGTLNPNTSLSFSNSLALSGSGTNYFVLSSVPGAATNDQIVVAGNLNLSGVTTMGVSYTALGIGRYKLITYGGALTGGTSNLWLTLSGVPQVAYLDASITNEIDLVVIPPVSLAWVGDGLSNNWDIALTENWLNISNSTPTYFLNAEPVVFNDSGSKSPAVNLVGALAPSSLVVSNNTGTYAFSGSGYLSGSTGLTKQGAGSLVIANSGVNSFSGGTTIAGGTVSITEDSALGAPPDSAVTNQLTLSGGKLQTAADMTFTPNRGITVGAAGGALEAIYSLGVECLLNGSGTLTISGGGELSLSHTNPAFTGNLTICDETLVSTFGASSFAGVFCKAGTITITNATLFAESGNNGPFGNPGTLVSGNVVVQPGGVLEIGDGVAAHIPRVLVLSGGELASSGTVNATYGSWNLDQGVTVNGGTNTSVISAAGVAVNQSGGTVFNVGSGAASGIDLDVTGTIDHFPSTSDNGLIKSGPGVMRLAGANTYTSATTISNGVLRVDGSLGAGALTVKSNGTLAGIGTVAGTVSVQNGGYLAPGDGTIGTLTVNNTLTLAGKTVVELNKSGTILTEDQVVGVSTLTYGGALVVTNTSDFQAIPLAPGDSFPLFSAATYTGAFTNVMVPVLPGGMIWDTNNLRVDGSITVVGNGAAPVITSQPQSLTVNSGSPASFTAVAAGPRPLAYQWRKNGTNIAAATTNTYTIASVGTNNVAAYAVVVTNAYGSVTSAVAMLALNAPAPATTVTNGLMVYLNFDNNLSGQLGTTVNGTLYTGGATNGPRYKTGVIGSAAGFANTGSSGQPSDWAVSLGRLESIYSNSFSVSFWERSASGAGALMGNKNWSSEANTGWAVSMTDAKNVNWNAVGGTNRSVDLNPPFSDGDWHLVTVTFNRVTNGVTSYLDGVAAKLSDLSPSASASMNAGANTLVGGSGTGTYAGAGNIDDLAVWNRVVTPDEVAAIYAAGLIGKPLNYAVPGLAPVIVTNLPTSVSVASGSSVTLSVTPNGSGPFTYQWRFNGVAIPGATNATLILAGVGSGGIDSSSEGVYTVLVSNGYGGVMSSKAVLTVYSRVVTGQWDFLRGDLRATVGGDLQYVGDTTNLTSFPMMSINGAPTPVMAFGSNAPSQGFTMWHGAMPNGGGQFVNQYTLILDVMFPASSSGLWRALFQTDPFNHPGDDAEFYVGSASATPAPNGIGAEGQYNGTLAPDTWYRIAFAVDLTASAGQQLSTYVNGVLAGQQSLSGGVDGRFALGPAAQLFTGGLNGGTTQPGYVSSIQFVNGCLPPATIAALGGPSADKLPPGDAAIQITNLAVNASQVTLNWGGPSGNYQVQHTPTLSPPAWQPASTLSTNHSLTLPASDEIGFYRVTQSQSDILVGQLPYGEQCISSKEIIRAVGNQVQFFGLPVDLVLSPDGRTVYLKNHNNLWVVDADSWTPLQTLAYPASGASMHGIAVSPDGAHVYVTSSANQLYDWKVAGGVVSYSRTISLASGSDPCGLAISADGTKAYVCLSIKNKLAVVNLTSGTVSQQITVGIAPWDVVLSPDGNTAYVSDWGGRYPTTGDLTMTSAGTAVVVDERGVPTSGVISVVNLTSGVEAAQVATGLHPSDLVLSPDGGTLYVANAMSDTVSVIDTQTRKVRETILVRPSSTLPFGNSSTLPFGSIPDGLALSADGTNLFVAVAGNNAVAVVELPNAQHTNSVVQGFFPTDWYPGAVVADSNYVYVANVKGLGTRYGQPATTAYTATGFYLGTANRIPIPSAEALSKYSAQVNKNGRISQIQQAQQPARSGQTPVPVPAYAGEPSVFQHVLYILKENKTYDQVFGDMAQGNGNPNLCVYPQYITPNHHALAQQYVLLDNFYCNGVNSAVGHSWCTEANDSDHLEKSFGGFVRSYGPESDPLSYVPTGFIWNNVLQHGLTFRNYGEFTSGVVPSGASWSDIYNDYLSGAHSILITNTMPLAPLRPYTSTNVPGWNLNIPDVVRGYGFIKELNAAQARGSWETFHFLWLGNDHTGGTPPARAQVADNDLTLGQVVEAVTKSIFGSTTVIFVIEDDPQSGYDHVDGHRSICLVISPYTKRKQVVSTFYNQAGLLHTMERIMGLPPMNQGDAMAPLMFDCFTNTPDFTAYTALPNNIDLATGGTAALSAKARYYAKKVQKMDFSKPDRIDDDIFNRYIWHSIKGDARYPSEFVGGHGKGLKKLGLVLAKTQKDDDD